MKKKDLTEADIITKFIMPAIESAGWDSMTQVRQEVKLRDGKVIVRGQIGMRKTVKSDNIKASFVEETIPRGRAKSVRLYSLEYQK